MVMLAAAPFIVYLFAAASDYRQSLRAIIGIDNGSGAQVPGFLALCLMFAAGLAVAWSAARPSLHPLVRYGALALSLALAAAIGLSGLALPFAHAVVANAVDPFTSSLVVPSVTPRRLTDQAAASADLWVWRAAVAYLAASAVAFLAAETTRHSRPALAAIAVMNGTGLAALLLFAYAGFAAGIATTLRAAVFAYALALLLGILWVGLLQLKASRRAQQVALALILLLAGAGAWSLLQSPDDYVIAGNFSGRTAVIKGTPAGLVSDVRLARFAGAPAADEIPVRTFADAASALAALAKGEVSAVLVQAAEAPAGVPVAFATSMLNDGDKYRGIAAAVMAIAIALMSLAGLAHGRHPLAVTAEFVIDTIRGIPMLVIVLYIGLPLAGALKDASHGILDPPNFLRGVVAMGLAYSAYLAEIMRAGVKAIPKGQFEAAASLGLTRWQVARLVVVPQAFRIILPALGNELIAIIKDTSLLSILSIRDITQRTREFQSASFLPFAPYNTAAIVYVILTLAAASLLSTIERKHDIKQR